MPFLRNGSSLSPLLVRTTCTSAGGAPLTIFPSDVRTKMRCVSFWDPPMPRAASRSTKET
jgi:hypothetical protein